MNDIAQNISEVNEVLADTSAQLVAVSKRQSQDKIQSALNAGQRVFGENQVQEAQAHWSDLRAANDYDGLQLHLIGSLQTNKAKDAVALFDVIETVDRLKMVDALVKAEHTLGVKRTYFIQVNTGAEPQKAGVLPEDLPDLLSYARDKELDVTGLMCIPPANEPSALHFAFLNKLAARHDLANLSMGMSSDYKKALALNATYVRVGTQIFGERTS